jgi:hypothetical protein
MAHPLLFRPAGRLEKAVVNLPAAVASAGGAGALQEGEVSTMHGRAVYRVVSPAEFLEGSRARLPVIEAARAQAAREERRRHRHSEPESAGADAGSSAPTPAPSAAARTAPTPTPTPAPAQPVAEELRGE